MGTLEKRGDNIRFEYTNGKNFLESAMSNPYIPAICLFGSDDHALQYQNSVKKFGNEIVGEPDCHPVEKMVFGTFGTVGVNQGRSESWKKAFVSKPVGDYGYSGWIWETIDEKFTLKQEPKLLSIETSQKP